MARDKPHNKLQLWNESIELVVLIYETTKSFPKDEEYGLKSQMRRAAVSIPSNISEGLTRSTKREKLRFLNISQASLSELDAQLEISERLSYISDEQAMKIGDLQTTVESLLSGLIRKLRQ